jgi:uncharacterized surface protein with fasciclin (FAS1) repeats
MLRIATWLATIATIATIATSATSALLVACASTSHPNVSILDTAKGNANLSTLVAVAQFASDNNDLVNLLANPGTSTVFAPGNAAFESLAKELTGSATATAADLLAPSNKALIKSVLQYHVLSSRVFKAKVPINTTISSALAGKSFSVSAAPAITDGRSRTANIVATDVMTSNGVIHVIDRVILPSL